MTTRYVIITPARDEAAYIEKTIQSVTAQTIQPAEWIIVNDGSVDDTGPIAESYAKQHPWIKVVHRDNRGFRKAGGGVIEAFYDGFNALRPGPWDFIVKLDGDLSFEPDYFGRCFDRFATEPKLGIAGGDIYHLIDGKYKLEEGRRFHVRGATKIYRRECWEAIGGLIAAPGWDAVDEVKANMLGWETKSLADLRVIHHRYTGGADGSWRTAVKDGRADYIVGYHPLFMLFKCVKRAAERPYVLQALALFYGFVGGYAKKIPRVNDKEVVRYTRSQQIARLLGRPSIWK